MRPVLELVAVRQHHRRGAGEPPVLDGITLRLHAHDFACILGDRGAGKTTLLEVACGIRPVDEGIVRYDGRDIASLRERERSRLRRSEIGCVWNRPPLTVGAHHVLDHVALPLASAGLSRQTRRSRASAVLDRVGALGEAWTPVRELSDAARTRVALAQACVREPKVLVADDLTNTLDITERNAILGILRSFALAGMAILLTAADAHGAAGCNRLLSLSSGSLIEAQPRDGGTVVIFPSALAREKDSAG